MVQGPFLKGKSGQLTKAAAGGAETTATRTAGDKINMARVLCAKRRTRR